MAQKVNPNAFRLGLTISWSGKWFFKRSMRYYLEEDHFIREKIREKILAAGIVSITIERTQGALRVIIQASRPGLIIGRGGKGIDDLRLEIVKGITALRKKNNIENKINLNLSIEELKRTDVSSGVVAQQMAFDIEKRKPYRGVARRALETIMQNRSVQGAKIKVAGRLNGAEISRSESFSKGRMPLQTLRANIDYAQATSFNTYGTIGIKVWIYKGDIFEDKQ